MSKLRYGLQLCSNVRIEEAELKNGNMKAVQIAQNKLMRVLANVSYMERTSTVDLLKKTGLLSINQTAASIKLIEVWKAENIENYPVKLEPNNAGLIETDRSVRPSTTRKWNQDAKTSAARESFSRNAAKIWNKAPNSIKLAKSLSLAKKEIKKHCQMLPI